MLDRLIELGIAFKDAFTEEDNYSEIDEANAANYFQWLGKIGTFSEAKLKSEYPEMTSQILKIIDKKSSDKNDYNIIIGYLETVKELEK